MRAARAREQLLEETRLVDGDHVLYVYERVLPAVYLECVQRLVYQIAHVLALLLRVVDSVAQVFCRQVNTFIAAVGEFLNAFTRIN